jgi:membrane protease YdiL (CAAX protease family)
MVRHPLRAYFALAYGISWLLWLPAILGHQQGSMSLADGSVFFFLGSFGPFLSAAVVTARSSGRAGVDAWVKGLLHWRVRFTWYLVALYGFPALGLLAAALLGIASFSEVLRALPISLFAVPANALTSFVVLGPLGEEPGWRGYALPRLQADRGALAASAVLGVLWAFWHGPLMFLPEWRNDVPIGPFLVLYPLYFIALTVIFTWVYNHASQSVLIAVILHASFNYTVYLLGQRFGLTRYAALRVQTFSVAVLCIVASLLIAASGPTLGLEQSPGEA